MTENADKELYLLFVKMPCLQAGHFFEKIVDAVRVNQQNKVCDLRIRLSFLWLLLMTFAQVGCGGESESEPVPTIASPAGWVLDWSDEFNGSVLNSANWNYDLGAGGWGNNELQFYQAQNAVVANGLLSINAKRESVGGAAYTSARIQTARKKTFSYGRFEIRAKLPSTQGMWPAFWLLGSTCNSFGLYGGAVNWPNCGEIDVMEMIGGGQRDNMAYGTIHYTNALNQYTTQGVNYNHASKLANDFHTYTLDWLPSGFTWYVDGVAYGSLLMPSDVNTFKTQTFFILLNFAVGGNWPGNPDGSSVLLQNFVVDYVRYFKKI